MMTKATEKTIFFALAGSAYTGGDFEALNSNTPYGVGYAIKREHSYLGQLGYSVKYSFVYNLQTKTLTIQQ